LTPYASGLEDGDAESACGSAGKFSKNGSLAGKGKGKGKQDTLHKLLSVVFCNACQQQCKYSYKQHILQEITADKISQKAKQTATWLLIQSASLEDPNLRLAFLQIESFRCIAVQVR
jgi:hypothetical protein